MQRLNNIQAQLQSNDADVVICYAKRTPLTRSKKGGLAGVSPEILLSSLLTDLATQLPATKELVNDVVVGNVL